MIERNAGEQRLNWTDVVSVLSIVMLCVAKHFVCTGLPIMPRYYNVDDELMRKMAVSLLEGGWLGPYSGLVLMKGCFFPLFTAAVHALGLSYLCTLDVLNTASSVFFCVQTRHLIRSRKLRLALLVVLLLNPVTFAELTFQRVYRNSIVAMLVLFLFGSYLGMYLRLHKEKTSTGSDAVPGSTPAIAALSLIAGTSLWALWNTREDSMWVAPFVAVATAVMVALIALKARADCPPRQRTVRVLLIALPIALCVAGNSLIARKNQAVYGSMIRLEVSDGTFANAMHSIYSVQNEHEVPYATVTQEKLERLYGVSPTLNSIRPELDAQIAYYDTADRKKNDGNVEDGWFFWALRKAAFENGAADSLFAAEEFYARISREIDAALDDPSSGLARQSTMPSVLMSPWRAEYASSLPLAIAKGCWRLIAFRSVGAVAQASDRAGNDTIALFEELTHSRAIYHDDASDALSNQDGFIARARFSAWIANGVSAAYQMANPIAAIAGVMSLVVCVISARKQEDAPSCISLVLSSLGLALSALVLVCGVAYTDISAFSALNYFNMVGAYALMLAAEWLPILYLVDQRKGAEQ